MKALIMDAGRASRLYPLSRITPKSLLDVKGKPVLEHILENIDASPQIKETSILHSQEFRLQFKNFNEHYNHPNLDVNMVEDKRKNNEFPGFIGGISYVTSHEEIKDNLLVVAGDNLFDFEINDFVQFFNQNGRKTSIAVYDYGNKEKVAQQFGVVELDDDNTRIKGFEEKPIEPKTAMASSLCYIISKKDLPYLDSSEIPRGNAGEFIDYLVKNSEVNAYSFKGKWFDIGTFDGLENARREFKF